jgi:hypothetical protein
VNSGTVAAETAWYSMDVALVKCRLRAEEPQKPQDQFLITKASNVTA